MNEKLIAPLVGGVLVLIGLALMAAHLASWRRRKSNPDLEESDRRHYRSRFRRRMQTSGMLALLGVLLAVGDWLPALRKNPYLFAVYWIGVLLLTLWVMLLAVGDFFSTRVHSRSALSRLQRKQQELEEEVARLRRRGSNGRDP